MIEKNWKEIIKPSKLDVKEDSNLENTSTIIAEPLERGYGVTIGNALRRILLSSLQGTAITSIQVQGVLHEFSSIPGVREEITRPDKIKAYWQDIEGRNYEDEPEGLLAVCFQHEIDHLEGKLLVDYISPLKRDRIRKKALKSVI